jgi:2,3-bisphosphoglycerate-dependent phosphoglycerate mutase
VKHTTDILAIRHGETQWNAEGRYQGQADIGLNDAGLAQARRIAAVFADAPIDAIYTSDLVRAHQTAVELAQVNGAPLLTVADLREQDYGVFQGLTGNDIAQRWPEASARWHRREADFGPEGGETRNRFSRRCVGALERLARAHVGGTIAVVCHGGVLDCLYRAASGLGMDARRTWALENAAVSRLRHGPEGFKIIDWGNTTHLDRRPTDDLPDLFPAP